MSKETSAGVDEAYRELRVKYLNLEAEHESLKQSNKRLSTDNSKLKTKLEGRESSPKVDHSEIGLESKPPEKAEEKKEEAKATPHLVESWHPRFCPDCGTQNPDFKNEVECASCGIALGSEEVVKSEKFKVCPNCGKGKENGGGYRRVRT